MDTKVYTARGEGAWRAESKKSLRFIWKFEINFVPLLYKK